ncbi:MAG: hypothetical protein GWP03_02205 [Proteobacteria bacterium]|nr:hypothetical protein [Pseudomonadota bacterium]
MNIKLDKDLIPVTIYTDLPVKVQGFLHVIKTARLSDMLKSTFTKSEFIPVTDCGITDLETGKTSKVGFVLLNRNHIVIIYENKG